MTDLPTYVLERSFDAPIGLVWRTWTEPDLVAHWYGPGVDTVIHKMDVEPGGQWLVEMKWGQGGSFQKADYEVVEPNDRLVWLQSNTDADWNTIANPMMADWPLLLHTTVAFSESGGKTHMKLTWVPHEASEAEIACFAAALAGMDKGWATGMDVLAEMLADMQS